MTMAFVARDAGTSAARRRRERRLRSMLRHERMTVAMALAEMAHHSAPRRPTMARARGEESEMNNATGQMTPPPRAASTEYYWLDGDGDVLAARPTPLVEVRPQPGGSAGTPRRTSRTSCRTCRSSMCLCRSWGTGWWTSCVRSTRRRLSSRLSPCPRSLWTGSRSAPCVVVHGELNSWWKCRRSSLIPLYSSGLPSRPLTFQFLMSRRSWWRGGLQGSRPGQNSTALVEQKVDIPVPLGHGGRVGLRFLPGTGFNSVSLSSSR